MLQHAAEMRLKQNAMNIITYIALVLQARKIKTMEY